MTKITRVLGVTMMACIALVALANCKPTSFLDTSGSKQAPAGTNESTLPQIGTGGSPGQSSNVTSTVPGGNMIGGNQGGEPPIPGNPPSPAAGDAVKQPVIIGSDSTPSPGSSSEAAGISPANGSTVCLQPAISVNLGLTDATRKDGAIDMTKIKLVVDGVDVTGKATVLGTMDYPQSLATITYVPDQPLAAGKHTASITTATPSGDTTYQWTFETADIPCQ